VCGKALVSIHLGRWRPTSFPCRPNETSEPVVLVVVGEIRAEASGINRRELAVMAGHRYRRVGPGHGREPPRLYLLATVVYPEMKARGYGKIITLSSVMAEVGGTGSLHYVTAKAGILTYLDSRVKP
jgi:hypothetical protein